MGNGCLNLSLDIAGGPRGHEVPRKDKIKKKENILNNKETQNYAYFGEFDSES